MNHASSSDHCSQPLVSHTKIYVKEAALIEQGYLLKEMRQQLDFCRLHLTFQTLSRFDNTKQFTLTSRCRHSIQGDDQFLNSKYKLYQQVKFESALQNCNDKLEGAMLEIS